MKGIGKQGFCLVAVPNVYGHAVSRSQRMQDNLAMVLRERGAVYTFDLTLEFKGQPFDGFLRCDS
jgi:hypothetical protein